MIVPFAVIVGIVVGVGVVVVGDVVKLKNGICFKYNIYFLVPYLLNK